MTASPKPTDNVLSHWYALIDGVHFSAQDFYGAVEDELAARRVPRLKTTRPEFFEGTSLSDKRVYLRLARERWAFEVCAAPFGRGYFFSLRFVELPRGGWLQLMLILLGLWLVLSFAGQLLRQTNKYFWMVIGLAAAILFGRWIISRAGEPARPGTTTGVFAGEMPDFDTFMLNLPVIGQWYESLRKDSYLLGSLLLAKFQQIAMGRQRLEEKERRDFWLYLDEFHHFITPSTAEILTGARKYRIGMTLAHQELRQLLRDPEVASAVLANPYTRVCFRVGDQDARVLENGLSTFEAKDLQNLGTGEAIARVERSDYDFNLKIPAPSDPGEAEAATRRQEVIEASRARYARSRLAVEAALHPPLEEILKRAKEKEIAARTLTPPLAPPPVPPPVVPSAPPIEIVSPRPILVPEPPVEAIAPPIEAKTVRPQRLSRLETPPVADRQPPADSKPVNQVATRPPDFVNPPVADEPLEEPTPFEEVEELGRGGAKHKEIQLQIKAAAEALGFRVYVEKLILGGSGCVDLVLEREGQRIACEVTVTNTLKYELGNVARCLKAGFTSVAVVGVDERKLQNLQVAVKTSLGEAAAAVSFHQPAGLVAYLQELKPAEPAMPLPPTTKVVRGYKVRTSYGQISAEERAARENSQIKLLLEMMRRKKSADPDSPKE